MRTTSIIEQREEQLRQAMLAGDVAALEQLLADDLTFVDQTGQVLTKQSDLEAHRSRTLVLHTLEPAEQHILIPHPATAIVSVLMRLAGTYAQQPIQATCRYLRVWAERGGQWQIVAGSISNVTVAG